MDTKNLKVSVLMPVLNGLPYLKDSIDSILSQTFKDFEFVIVNDLSTDGTTELLNDYAKKDKRVRILQNKTNKGIVFSLNRGLKESSGDYVVRMDSDDIAINDRIEKQVEAMDKDPDIAVMGSAASYIDATGNELGIITIPELDSSILIRSPLNHSTAIIRRKHLTQYGIYYKEEFYSAQDYFLWLRLSKVGKISALNDILLKYRLTKDNSINKKTKEILWDTLMAKKYAIFVLKIKPNAKAIIKMFLELILLLLPAKVVLFLHLKISFRKGLMINS